jgi:hypothetical protein
MAINADKLLNKSSGRLAMQKAQQEKMIGGGPVNIVLTKKSIKGIEGIKINVIKIENILKGSLALDKKQLDDKKKATSKKRKDDIETKLETKPNVESGKVKMPSAPRMGILDFIKNFIGNVLLGYFAVRLIKHLPKIMPIVKFLGNATDFIINTGGELLNGLVSFIDIGYKAYDATRGFIKNLGGENFAKGFDKFLGAIDTALFLTTALAASLAIDAVSGDGDPGIMDMFGKKGAAKAAGSAAKAAGSAAKGAGLGAGAVAGVVAGAGLLASALGEGAFQLRKIATKPIQDAKKAFDNERNPLMKIGRGALLGGMYTLLGPLSAVGVLLDIVGAPFRYAIELLRFPFLSEEDKVKQAGNLAKFDARIREDFRKALNMVTLGFAFKEKGSFGNIYGNKGAQKEMMGKMQGGGIARGGRSRGRVKRTLSKGKYKRVLAPQKPSKTELKTEAFIKNKNLKESTEELDKTKYFGPILAISSKIMNKEEPTDRDYQNVGLGINLLIAKGIQDGQLKGGIIAKFAGGGLVDPDVLSAIETGGDISNWVAKTFRGEVESNAQKTMRLMKEMREMEKRKKEKDEGAGGATGDFTPGSVPGGQLTMEQLVGLAKGAGFPTNEAVIMAAIAKGESGGNSNAKNFKPPDKSYGLWQINMIGNLGPARMQEFGLQREDQLFDPVTNAKAAYAIRKSQGLSAWTIYKNGAYKNHLSAAEAAKNAPSLRTSPSFGSMELGKGYGTEGSKIAGELGRFMKKKGVVPGSVHRHPEHPPYSLSSGHSRNSLHYQGRAIDLGAYANEQGPVLAAVAEFNKLKGVKPVQVYHGGNDPDHADHVHVAYALGGRVPKLTFAMLGERGPEFVFDANTTAGLDRLAPQLLEKLNFASTKPQLASILQSYAPYDANASSQTIIVQSSSVPSGGRNNNSSGGGVAVIPIPVDNFTEILAMIG